MPPIECSPAGSQSGWFPLEVGAPGTLLLTSLHREDEAQPEEMLPELQSSFLKAELARISQQGEIPRGM